MENIFMVAHIFALHARQPPPSHTALSSHTKIDYTLNFFLLPSFFDQISINKRDVFVIILLLISSCSPFASKRVHKKRKEWHKDKQGHTSMMWTFIYIRVANCFGHISRRNENGEKNGILKEIWMGGLARILFFRGNFTSGFFIWQNREKMEF